MLRTQKQQLSPSPESSSSMVSRLFFLWIWRLIEKANITPLTENDVWDIDAEDKCRRIYPAFEKEWTGDQLNPDSSSHLDIHGEEQVPPATPPDSENIRHRKSSTAKQDKNKKDSKHFHQTDSLPGTSVYHSSLLVVILKTFWYELAFFTSLKLVHALSEWISSPYLIGLLIESTADPDSSIWTSVILTVIMVVVLIIGRLAYEHCNYRRQTNHLHIDTVLRDAVFRKALTLHTSSRTKYSVGQMTNLMSSDVGNISGKISNLAFLSYLPLYIIVIFCQLFFILGPAAGLGVLVVVLLQPINLYIAHRINLLFAENAKNKDEKMKLLNEVLTGMKVLKLLAWENRFGDILRNIREKEMKILKRMTYYRALHICSWNIAPYVISVAMFTGYFYLNQDSILTVKTAFAVISALNVLRMSINLTPDIINDTNKLRLSVSRVESFLREREFSPINTDTSRDEIFVEIENASFTWNGKTRPVLRNVDLSVPRASLVAVVGQVGAGKSALVSAILGEIEKIRGNIRVMGRIAYVPQQAWIQNDTLQNNILFGKSLDRRVYKKVIDACALQSDIDVLAAGDLTEIGERGINLSGGQKQRVSLARAVYNDADIYLLDDPLSAVDSHVGKHIFDNVIKGMLKEKICILVTHNLRYLPDVDNIVVLDNGTVAESGSFRDLLNSNGAFTSVLKTYITDYEENMDCLEDLESEENACLDVELKMKLKRLESEDMSQEQTYKRQKSREIQRSISRQTSRHKSTSDDEKPAHGKCIQEEKIVNVDKKTWWPLMSRYIQAYGVWNMVGLLVFYSMYYLMYLQADMLLMWWTDDDILKTINDSHFTPTDRDAVWKTNMYYLNMYTTMGIGLSLFILLYAYMMSRGVVRASQHLHDNMLNSILQAPMAFFDTTPVGRITNRFSHDMNVVDNMMPSCLEFWLDCIFNITIGIGIILYTTPGVLVLFIPVIYYYIYLQKHFIPVRTQLNSLKVKTMSPVVSYFTESVTGSEIIRAFQDESRFINKMQNLLDALNRMRFYGFVAYRWFGVNMLGLGYVIFGATTLLKSLTKGTVSAAVIGFGSSYAMELNGNLRWLVFLQSDLETHLTSVERIEQYINAPREARLRQNRQLLTSSWPDAGKVEFKNFSLRYRPGLDLVLRNISFIITGGEKIGVVGRTGAGKSSLMLSLFRLVEPAEGTIFIDGVDIGNIGLHDLREKLAIIPQDPVLFTGSLRMNLDPQDMYRDQDIWTALDHTHLRQFVESLPDRLKTDCGEGGNNFSVGQRQLFCMARTLLLKAKILVLDEATAAVDMETDDLIQQTIRSEFKDCTVLTIAHRINTVMDYDRILVLDRGHVVEFDTPYNLLQIPDGVFCNMATAAGISS